MCWIAFKIYVIPLLNDFFLSPELVAGVPRGAQNFGYVSTKNALLEIFLYMQRNVSFYSTFKWFKIPFNSEPLQVDACLLSRKEGKQVKLDFFFFWSLYRISYRVCGTQRQMNEDAGPFFQNY